MVVMTRRGGAIELPWGEWGVQMFSGGRRPTKFATGRAGFTIASARGGGGGAGGVHT